MRTSEIWWFGDHQCIRLWLLDVCI